MPTPECIAEFHQGCVITQYQSTFHLPFFDKSSNSLPEASLHEGALEEGDRVEEGGEGVPVVRVEDDGGGRGR